MNNMGNSASTKKKSDGLDTIQLINNDSVALDQSPMKESFVGGSAQKSGVPFKAKDPTHREVHALTESDDEENYKKFEALDNAEFKEYEPYLQIFNNIHDLNTNWQFEYKDPKTGKVQWETYGDVACMCMEIYYQNYQRSNRN